MQNQQIGGSLAQKTQAYAQGMLQKQESLLLLCDKSVQEKPESLAANGLHAVISSRAKRPLELRKAKIIFLLL